MKSFHLRGTWRSEYQEERKNKKAGEDVERDFFLLLWILNRTWFKGIKKILAKFLEIFSVLCFLIVLSSQLSRIAFESIRARLLLKMSKSNRNRKTYNRQIPFILFFFIQLFRCWKYYANNFSSFLYFVLI